MAKRAKPYNPARDVLTPERAAQVRGQLGIPTPQRVAKSNGFAVDVMIEGDIPVVRAREKRMLTPPAVRRGLIEEALKDLRDRGIFEIEGQRINIPETSLDRLLNAAEHEALCWFVAVHAKVKAGHVKIVNYGQALDKAQDERDRPLLNRDKAMHAELLKLLPEPYLVFLDWLAWHEEPGTSDGVPLLRIEIGKQIIDSRDARRAEGGIEGYVRAVAQNIAHWRGEVDTMWRRREMLTKELYDHRKKAYA